MLMSGRAQSLRARSRPDLRRLATAAAALAILVGTAREAEATSIPGYDLIDTIVVPTNGTAASSSISLDSGVSYKLRAAGTFVTGSGVFGDAEYLFGVVGPADYCINGGLSYCDYGIAIDDPTVGGLKLPYWGTYDASHQYTIDFVGLGTQLSSLPRRSVSGQQRSAERRDLLRGARAADRPALPAHAGVRRSQARRAGAALGNAGRPLIVDRAAHRSVALIHQADQGYRRGDRREPVLDGAPTAAPRRLGSDATPEYGRHVKPLQGGRGGAALPMEPSLLCRALREPAPGAASSRRQGDAAPISSPPCSTRPAPSCELRLKQRESPPSPYGVGRLTRRPHAFAVRGSDPP